MLALIFENSPLCKPYYLITSRSTIDHEIRCFTGRKMGGKEISTRARRYFNRTRTFLSYLQNIRGFFSESVRNCIEPIVKLTENYQHGNNACRGQRYGCANIHFHSDATRVAAVVDGGNRRPVNNLIRW